MADGIDPSTVGMGAVGVLAGLGILLRKMFTSGGDDRREEIRREEDRRIAVHDIRNSVNEMMGKMALYNKFNDERMEVLRSELKEYKDDGKLQFAEFRADIKDDIKRIEATCESIRNHK